MALAVALYLTSGGNAWAAVTAADEVYIDADNGNTISARTGAYVQPEGAVLSPVMGGTGKVLTITGGDWSNFAHFKGGWSIENGLNLTGYAITLDGVTTTTSVDIYGAKTSGAAQDNAVTLDNSTIKAVSTIQGGYSDSGAVSGNTVTIGANSTVGHEGEDGFSIYGGRTGAAAATGNTVTIKGKILTALPTTDSYPSVNITGGYSGGTGEVSNNKVNFESGSVFKAKCIYITGGHANNSGNANNNQININGATIYSNRETNIYGGRADGSGSADGNTITIKNSDVNSSRSGGGHGMLRIYGGHSQTGTGSNNTINLLGDSYLNGHINFYLYGSNETAGTGNELHIGGVKGSTDTNSANIWKNGYGPNTINNIVNFETLALHDVAWNTYTSALEARVINGGTLDADKLTLDITNLKIYDGDTIKQFYNAGESMNLFTSWTDLSNLKLKYNAEAAALIPAEGVIVATRNFANQEAATGLTFTGNQTDKVTLDQESKKKIVYTAGVTSNITAAKLATELKWNTSDTYKYYENKNHTFTAASTFDLSGLTITADSALTENPVGTSMTLLTGNILGTVSSQPTTTPAMAVSLTQSNATLGGQTSAGEAAISDGKLSYKVTGVTLNSVTINGVENGAVPAGWTAPTTGKIAVNAGTGYTEPADAATILSGTDTLKFTADNTEIADSIKYKAGTAETETAATNGVKLTYAQSKGIKADGTNLIYAVGNTKDVSLITLGQMNINTPREMAAGYDFTNATVDASGLVFDNPQDVSGTKTLVKNATNLPAGAAVSYGGTATQHTQKIENAVDNASGIAFNGTLNGQVATVANAVQYTVTAKALDSVALAGWNGTTLSQDLAGNWTLTAGATVNTDGISDTVISGLKLAPGATAAIMENTTGADYFAGVTISGSRVWKEDGSALEADPAGTGISATGTQTQGGVKVNENNKNQLVYEESKKKVTKLQVVSPTFNAGGTARTFDNTYDLTGAAISVADSFNYNGVAMDAGATMTMVDASDAIKSGGKALTAYTKDFAGVTFNDKVTDNLTLAGTHDDTLSTNDASTKLVYTVGAKNVNNATMSGAIDWQNDGILYTNKQYTFTDDSDINIGGVKFTAAADPNGQSMTLIKAGDNAHAVKGKIAGTPDFTVKLNNTTLSATVTGTAAIDDNNDLKYKVNAVQLDKVTVGTVGSDAVPTGWTYAENVAVDTDSMTIPTDVTFASPKTILTADSGVFADANITGTNKFGAQTNAINEADTVQSTVKLTGSQNKGVKASADKKSLVYALGTKDISKVEVGSVKWAAGDTLLDGSSAEYDYSAVKTLSADNFAATFASPLTVKANDSMTLLAANETLNDFTAKDSENVYTADIGTTGVSLTGRILSTVSKSGNNIAYTISSNTASALTFGDVEWKDTGAIIDHSTTLANVVFDNANVNTENIKFTNINSQQAGQSMTLVSNFGDAVGTIQGDTYTVGSGLKGKGKAALKGKDLIFTTETGTTPTEAAHNVVMGSASALTALSAGNNFIGDAIAGLSQAGNTGDDGVAIYANMGGGTNRQETGSHVNVRTWNAIIAVGHKNNQKQSSTEYGAFFEYGRGNYTTYNDGEQGDGSMHYTGGGLMAKWQQKNGFYVEGSIRAGRVSDNANNVLRDAAGNSSSYKTSASYWGTHIGLGREISLGKGRTVDVYGKYFYNRKAGVNFTAAGNDYNLDAVASQVIRIGARYTLKREKWNYYGGLAYEHELDGKAFGRVDDVDIRSASIKGGSVFGELGAKMLANGKSPWELDIHLHGFTGKKRGVSGGISAAYRF